MSKKLYEHSTAIYTDNIVHLYGYIECWRVLGGRAAQAVLTAAKSPAEEICDIDPSIGEAVLEADVVGLVK